MSARQRSRGSDSPSKAPARKQKKKVCAFCKDRTSYIDYKDTALLRKFISDRGTRRGEAQLRVIGHVADDGDDGFACHGASTSLAATSGPDGRPWFAARLR